MIKLHRPLIQAVITTIQQIFIEGVYAHKAVELVLKQNPKWGGRDRRFIADTTYEMVRWWRLLQTIAEQQHIDDDKAIWKLIGAWCIVNNIDLPQWQEFENINKQNVQQQYQQAQTLRKHKEAIPDWLDELACEQLGEAVWTNEIHCLNQEAKIVLRVNTLKTNQQVLQNSLREQEIETLIHPNYNDALILVKRQKITQLEQYKQGLFEIQDASSQLVAPFMQLQPGMTVIDACAGAGGKALHIASLLQNKGKIIAMDIVANKLTELKKRALRANASIIHTEILNAQTISKYKHTADRLLLDVPCSGLGVMRRNPDTKWKLNNTIINQLLVTQAQIISRYATMLKPGGILIYATCSILPSENEEQIKHFLAKRGNDFQFVNERKILPSQGFDGFYMAALGKKK